MFDSSRTLFVPVVGPGILGVACAVACSLTACSGGDSGSSSTPNPDQVAPAVNSLAQVDARFPYETFTDLEAAGDADRPNVLLITLDTARKDRFSCYGYPTGTTPNVDALARESILFEDAYASAPVTLPSHATILTGLEPFEHGVRNNGIHSLAPEFTTLAERLKGHGYATGAVIGGFPVSSQFGLAQGFDHYDDDLTASAPSSPVPERLGTEVSSRGLQWIREHRSDPWFAWLHYFDPHDPYLPPAPFDGLFPGEPYDGEMAYMDAHLGALFRELRRQGLWENTMIVLTSDHGEGLGDHGEPTHSMFLYNTTVAVPLIVKFPNGESWSAETYRGRRLGQLAATTDIVPTVLDVAGLAYEPRSEYAGVSLLPMVTDGTAVRDAAYMETLVPELDYGWSPYRGLREDDYKLIFATRPELFDIAKDPGELENLYESRQKDSDRLLEGIVARLENDHTAENMAMDAATIEKLRSLGYVAGGGTRSDGPLPDPKDMAWALDAFDQARSLLVRKEIENASNAIAAILAKDPGNKFAQRMHGWVLIQEGRGKDAEELSKKILLAEPEASDRNVVETRLAEAVLIQNETERAAGLITKLLEDDPNNFDAWILRIRAAGETGDFNTAEEAAAKATSLDPKSWQPPVTLARVYESKNRWEKASQIYDASIEELGPLTQLLSGQAAVKLQRGDAPGAVPLIQGVLQADPNNARANYQMGSILVGTGRPGQAMSYFVRAATTEPGNGTYQAGLGTHCLLGKLYPKAVLHLTRAIELGNDTASTRGGLGLAQAETGNTETAKRNIATALRMNPNPQLKSQLLNKLSEL